jgi:hypothetical protein
VEALADLARRMSGKIELVCQGSTAMSALRALGGEVHATGETIRAVMTESRLDEAIDTLRRSSARLISITPVRITLEDYFLEQLREAGSPHFASGETKENAAGTVPPPPVVDEVAR